MTMNIDQINNRVDQMLDRGYSVPEIDGWLAENGVDPVKLYEHNKRQREYGAGDIARTVAQGLTLNFWDEIEGRLRSLGGGEYQNERDKVRAEMDRYSTHHPGKALLGEAAGIVAPAVLTGGGSLLGSAPAAARGAGAAVARSGLAGAGAGAIEGAGLAPEMGDVLPMAGMGMAVGGAAGAALPAAMSAAGTVGGAVARTVRDAVGSNPASGAARRVRRAMEADELGVDDVVSRMQELGPEAVAGEAAGPSTMSLFDVAAQRGGRAGGDVREHIEGRARTQQGRLAADLAETTGVNTNFYDDFNALDRALRDNAARDYSAAYARPVEFTGELEGLIQRPDVADAWRTARRSAANQGRPLPEYFTYDDEGMINGVVRYPDMEAWDWIKRGLDARIEKNTDPVTGRVNPAGRDTLGLKNDLLDILDRENPAYATARSNYSGTAALRGAMEQGRRIFRDDAEISQRIVRDMGNAEREAYIRGAARAIRDKILQAGEGDSVARKAVFKSPMYRERLRPAFPDEASYQRFLESMRREELFQNTRNRLYRGSQTYQRQAAEADAGVDPNNLTEAIVGGPGALPGIVMREARKIFGPALGEADADEIMRILGAQDPRVLRDAMAAGQTHPLWERIGRILGWAPGRLQNRPGAQGYAAGALTEAGLARDYEE